MREKIVDIHNQSWCNTSVDFWRRKNMNKNFYFGTYYFFYYFANDKV